MFWSPWRGGVSAGIQLSIVPIDWFAEQTIGSSSNLQTFARLYRPILRLCIDKPGAANVSSKATIRDGIYGMLSPRPTVISPGSQAGHQGKKTLDQRPPNQPPLSLSGQVFRQFRRIRCSGTT